MGDDNAIVAAARTSFLGDSKGEDADKKLLFYLMKHRHTTPFEMVEFKFRVHAPLVTWWQWVRHRTFSFNAQSGRYTEFGDDDVYIPTAWQWRLQSSDNKQASDGLLPADKGEYFTKALSIMYSTGFAMYQQALEAGIAREQARLFLPGFGVYYTWVVKVDAHNLMHFLKLRMALEAQHEIRVYAEAIYEHFFKPALPWTTEAFERFVMSNS
jgi:thymidylate synthase (FAD)